MAAPDLGTLFNEHFETRQDAMDAVLDSGFNLLDGESEKDPDTRALVKGLVEASLHLNVEDLHQQLSKIPPEQLSAVLEDVAGDQRLTNANKLHAALLMIADPEISPSNALVCAAKAHRQIERTNPHLIVREMHHA